MLQHHFLSSQSNAICLTLILQLFYAVSHHHFFTFPFLVGSFEMSNLDGSVAGESSGEIEMGLSREERDCRICHLGLDCGGHEIELGCSCKGDLGAAHKQCAETWFKIKGDSTCEICGDIALNVVIEQIREARMVSHTNESSPVVPIILLEPQTSYRGHGGGIMNCLLACVVFGFVISWLFHFNVI